MIKPCGNRRYIIRRFGVSIPHGLLRKFDNLLVRKNYKARSEAIRDMIRAALLEESKKRGAGGYGVLSFVYDHHVPGLSDSLTDLQHGADKLVVSSMHVHLDARNCLEVIVLRGSYRRMKRFADGTMGLRGVKYGSFAPMTGVPSLP